MKIEMGGGTSNAERRREKREAANDNNPSADVILLFPERHERRALVPLEDPITEQAAESETTPEPVVVGHEQVHEEAEQEPNNPRQKGASSVFESRERSRGAQSETPAEHPQSWDFDPVRFAGIHPTPLKDILAVKETQQLYGELLHSLAPDLSEGIFARITQGVLTPEESKVILYAQHEMARRLKEAEAVAAKITEPDVILMMKRDETFRQMAMLHGPQVMAQILREEIPHLAMRDTAGFTDLSIAYRDLTDERKTREYKRWDKRVRTWCKKRGVSEYDLAAYDTEEGRDRMKGTLAQQYREEASTFQHAISRVSELYGLGSSFDRKANRAIKEARRFNAPIQDPSARRWVPKFISDRLWPTSTAMRLHGVDSDLNTITNTLRKTIADDALHQRLLIEAVTGVKQSDPRREGAQSFREVGQLQDRIKPGDLQRWYDRDLAEHAQSLGKENLSSEEEQAFFGTWTPPEVAHIQKQEAQRQGFWASIARALFGAFWAEQKNTIKRKSDQLKPAA